MTTIIVGWVLVLLGTGQPVGTFQAEDQCIIASYQVSFRTGQETRCEPRYVSGGLSRG